MGVESFDIKVAENGRMVLPLPAREALGLKAGGKITLTVEDESVSLHAMSSHVRRAQELYRKFAANPRGVDEFLADRKGDQARRDDLLAGSAGSSR